MKKICSKIKHLFIIVCFIFIVLLSYFLLKPFPEKDNIDTAYPESFKITKKNIYEKQLKNECAGFSVAYVLRHYDIRTTGEYVYENISYKIPFTGYVLLKGVIEYLNNYNIRTKLMKGSIESLKTRVSKGNPIIVLIGNGLKKQHLITIVGYDKNNFYFYDSNSDIRNNDNEIGNRTMTENNFLSEWNNGLPIFNKIYIITNQ